MSNAPVPEYHQHHDVEPPRIDAREFRPAWRSRSRLRMLFETGKIGKDELAAGLAWRGWCEAIGRMHTQSWDIRVSTGRASGTPTPRQFAAAHQLTAAAAALGADRVRVLRWSVVEDLPWRMLAARLRCDHKTAARRAVEALAALALWRDQPGSR